MEVKQKECCVADCQSSTGRKEDRGVTFHKLPKNEELRAQWCEATRHCQQEQLANKQYVCSRHFYKADFETFMDSKYLLRAGAVPSIFSWSVQSITKQMDSKETEKPAIVEKRKYNETDNTNNKGSIESKDKNNYCESEKKSNCQIPDSENAESEIVKDEAEKYVGEDFACISASPNRNNITVMRMIHIDAHESDANDSDVNDSEVNDFEVNDIENDTLEVMDVSNKGGQRKITCSTDSLKNVDNSTTDKDEGDSAFSDGSRVEVKDFGEIWHPALIMEVDDSDDMEVLVHYDNAQRHDEWISVSSPRIRSLTVTAASCNDAMPLIPTHPPSEIKIPLQYKVGERCYARWSDNRRFPATVRAILDNGKYEIIFDDGICRVCQWYCLSKMKTKKLTSPRGSISPPTRPIKAAPTLPVPAPIVPFHRHLFDPNLDYLGPKSERREMKKKLDVKTLFNIGKRNITKNTKRKKSPPAEVPPAKKQKGRERKKVSLSVEEVASPKVEEKISLIVEEVASPKVEEKISLIVEEVESPKVDEKMPLMVEVVASAKLEVKDEVKCVVKEEEKQESEVENMTIVCELPSIQSPAIEPEITSLCDEAIPQFTEVKNEEGLGVEYKLPLPDEISCENQVISEDKDNMNIALEGNSNIIEPEVLIPEKTKSKSSSNMFKEDIVSDEVHCLKEKQAMECESSSLAEPLIQSEPNNSVIADNINNAEENIIATDAHIVAIADKSVGTQEDTVEEDISYIPAPTTDPSLTDANYSANIPLEDMQGSYTMDIDEGLKLIAEAVESFEADQALKAEMKLDIPESESLESKNEIPEKYEATLNEGEWCCRWVDEEPQGAIYEMDTETPAMEDVNIFPRKSVQVEDLRLPPNWKKILVRRCYGNSAGKWDIVLIDPNNRRLRDKGEMRNYLNTVKDEELMKYERVLMDFSVHRKLARRMGWDSTTTAEARVLPIVMSTVAPFKISRTPKIKPLKLKKKATVRTSTTGPSLPKKKKKWPVPVTPASTPVSSASVQNVGAPPPVILDPATPMCSGLPDEFVYVGSMKVQIIENLFRCPAEGCFKNFRKDDLLRMHIKHYHRELRKFLGSTPKVSDLAYARTAIPEDMIIPKLRCEGDNKFTKLKMTPKVEKAEKKDASVTEAYLDSSPSTPGPESVKNEPNDKQSSLQDSPKLRIALENQLPPVKRPKVLYPVKKELKSEHSSPRPGTPMTPDFKPKEDLEAFVKLQKLPEIIEPIKKVQPEMEHLDFEAEISTHTVTKPTFWKRKQKKSPRKTKADGSGPSKKKRKSINAKWTPPLEAEQWDISDPETRSSYSTPQSKTIEKKVEVPDQPIIPYVAEIPIQDPDFMISETGEKIKIVHMKREEIINCHCGFGEEDGLMIQCDLCLCWQHAICYGYNTNTVPDKYICSICVNPRRGRTSRRFQHDQAWLFEGELPGGAPDDALRRAHELTGNLLKLSHVLHTLRLKYHVATKKDHPKLYLWAKDWESTAHLDRTPHEKTVTEPLNHVDLNAMFREIGKENLPLKDIGALASEEVGECQKEDSQLGSQALLANLLSSPGGPSLDLPISTSELERLAKSVQECDVGVVRGGAPEPEVAIESSACRRNLLRHIQRLQALIDSRLDSIEAQVAELESQDPSFEDDETAEYFPRTKQTIQMLHRDLDTMHELGIIT